MQLASVILGALIVAAGGVLVFTHGVIGGTNLPEALGLPCGGGGNSTFCPGFGGFSIGTIVLIAGFPILLRGLTAPAAPKGMTLPPAGMGLPPEALAMLSAATMARQMGATPAAPTNAPPTTPPEGTVRCCPNCGQPNPSASSFCNKCGKSMPKMG